MKQLLYSYEMVNIYIYVAQVCDKDDVRMIDNDMVKDIDNHDTASTGLSQDLQRVDITSPMDV